LSRTRYVSASRRLRSPRKRGVRFIQKTGGVMASVLKFKTIDHGVDLIKNQAVFLNSPFNFNDPLDSYFATLFGQSKAYLPLSIQEYIDIAAELGIFCGTTVENLTNVLMWTHYADYHRGIALKYTIPDQLIGQLESVKYDNHLHEDFMKAIGYRNPMEIPDTTSAEKEQAIFRSVFLKNIEWKYEDEVRYVKRIKKAESRIEQGWKVDEVYFGYKFLSNSEADLEQLIAIVDLCLEKGIRVYDYGLQLRCRSAEVCPGTKRMACSRKHTNRRELLQRKSRDSWGTQTKTTFIAARRLNPRNRKR
jgi:Protein of unknown function (DUF2971)